MWMMVIMVQRFMKYGRMSDVDDGDNGTTIYEVWEDE
jgi:hypothetical protein